VLTNLEQGGCVVLWRGEEERRRRALARGGRRRRAPAQVLARTLRPPWPPAQSLPVRQGHSPAQSMAVRHSVAPPSPADANTCFLDWMPTATKRVESSGEDEREQGSVATRCGGARMRRSPRDGCHGGGRRAVLGGGVDDVTCSDELVRVRLHGVDEGGG
jgi:hypothetical protein